MAVVRPFCGIRYSLSKVGDLSKVTAPPYDQINRELQEELHRRHPLNVIRLILGLDGSNDSIKDNKYLRSSSLFQEWFINGILLQDSEPAIYVYQQEFTLKNKIRKRTGYVALVEVEPFERGIILPHEKILPKPFEDRKKLLIETGVHFESIFLLYEDKDGKTNQPKNDALNETPIMEAQDDLKVVHRIWALTNPLTSQNLIKFWAPLKFYIADGHHRYNTAINHTRYCLATLFSMEDPDLVILPTHRLIKNINGFQEENFIEAARRYFLLEDIDSLEILLGLMEEGFKNHEHLFGLITLNSIFLMKLMDNVNLQKFSPPGVSKTWMNLDVSVLHQIVIDHILGVTLRDLVKGENVEYIRWPKDAESKVKDNSAQIAFLLNPTRIEEVSTIALQNETMPQKSTDFYPKLLSGLLMYKCDPNESL